MSTDDDAKVEEQLYHWTSGDYNPARAPIMILAQICRLLVDIRRELREANARAATNTRAQERLARLALRSKR